MRKIPITREQVLATWEVTKVAALRLSDAQTNYTTKLADAPDIQKLQSDMNAFRAEHAEIKRRREAEFAAAQLAVKALADARVELHRAEKAVIAVKKAQDRAERRLTL